MEKEKTPVEWLSEKYSYVDWLRNRDEISAESADKQRKSYLEQAKEMEKNHGRNYFVDGYKARALSGGHKFDDISEMYAEELFDRKYERKIK